MGERERPTPEQAQATRKALFERWGWGHGSPPSAGRIADRLHDIAESLRGVQGAETALEDLDSLRASLDAWSFFELNESTTD